MTEPFTVLFVCSGNICRSPIAEQALRARTDADGIVVASAGTIAREGMAMTEEAMAMSRLLGGDPSDHVSRRLTAQLVRDADLVLTAAREHRARVVELFPRASAYGFTLRQFARLVALGPLDPVGSGEELVAQVAARRGYAAPVARDADDVPDPYRRPLAVYEAAAALIDDALTTIAPAFSLVR